MPTHDAAAKIALYEQRVNSLYDLVESAIRRLEPGATFVRTSPVKIDEQLTGPYSVPSLEVSIPGKMGIRFIPKGIYNIGARGRVDARSRLGTEVVVWVEKGGPVLTVTARKDEDELESSTLPVFPGVPEGWAWMDEKAVELLPLTEDTLIDRVLPKLVA